MIHSSTTSAACVFLALATHQARAFEITIPFDEANTDLNIRYDDARGYGFEGNSDQVFSVRVPEGTYRVVLRLRGGERTSFVSARAESRRFMLDRLQVLPRAHIESAFIVNVRQPKLEPPPKNAPGGTSVRLKSDELASYTWDDKLTIEWNLSEAKLEALQISSVQLPTVFLLGDSTVTDQRVEPAGSWGQILPRFFTPTIVVANHAESGETLKSFLFDLRLAKVLETVRPGDWVMIQFGHNDQKSAWPQTFAPADTAFRAYLCAYVAEVQARGATPILVTSPERRTFDEAGRIIESHAEYPKTVKAVAKLLGVALIDLQLLSIRFYEALGPERAALAFADQGRDHTHHNNYGAYQLAAAVAANLRQTDPRLAHHVKDVSSFDVSRPDPPETFSFPFSMSGVATAR